MELGCSVRSVCGAAPLLRLIVKHVQVQKNLTQYQGTPAPLISQSKIVVCFEDLL